ncbi:hypothetical protein [Xenorhabdus sp. TS4]|uniref:OB-fold protein n=1 Tax=Xenorhabdus sp. TS4 TaxID=1873483 RepID=UPI001656AAAE|nr:hypothetical protein [Xenorhabdus sp. TS4]MBC8951143.1 hypothetical protein [Xenorhabdus sp. TS4]
MLRKFAAVLFLVSAVANSAGLPDPQDKVAFNNFNKVLTDFFIKDELESVKDGKKVLALEDTYGPYSAEEMYRDYKRNELVASNKYKGKKNRILGTVESVTENFMGNAVVKTVNPNYFLGGAMLNVDKNDPYVLNLVPGSSLDMVCRGRGFVMDSPVLDKCVSTESYIHSQFSSNAKTKKEIEGVTYLFYVPNEDILGKECNTLTSCKELASIFERMNKDDITEDEKKKVIKMLMKHGVTKASIDERKEKMKNFFEQYKVELNKRFGLGKSLDW